MCSRLYSLSGCGGSAAGDTEESVDVDLTQLSTTMLYSEVYSIISKPEEYAGKTIRMYGTYGHSLTENTKRDFHVITIAGGVVCCPQDTAFGLEFVLSEKAGTEYPRKNSNILISGVYETYEEDGAVYGRLVADELKTGLDARIG